MNLKPVKYVVASLLLVCTGIVCAEPAGNVIRLIGTVSAVDTTGTSRLLTAGNTINVGDTIRTGEKSAVQIQMKDAAVIAVTANAALKIDTYSYQKGAPKAGTVATPDKIVMILQKGRFRTITGNAKKAGYAMKSPIAKVSIEGTIFDMLMYPGDDLTTTVILREGAVLVQGDKSVCNCDVSKHLDVPGDYITIGKKQPKDKTDDLDAILPLPGATVVNPGELPPPLPDSASP